jgi:hypothetical protein
MTAPGDAALRCYPPLRFTDMRGPSWRQDELANRLPKAGLIGRVGLIVAGVEGLYPNLLPNILYKPCQN